MIGGSVIHWENENESTGSLESNVFSNLRKIIHDNL